MFENNNTYYKTSITIFMTILFIGVLLSFIMAVLIAKNIANPLKIAVQHLDYMAGRNIGKVIPEVLLNRKGESGRKT